jgi:5'-methylthioadenosine phosphorylase
MIGIIGGTGVYNLVERGKEIESRIIETPYGESPSISLFTLGNKRVAFMPRHREGHLHPPHMINYRANICALKKLGVKRIIATNAVGSLHEHIKPGDFLVPNDFLDFTSRRKSTFHNQKTIHVDVTQPYCPHLREVLLKSGQMIDGGVYVCTEGPRFETPAEIEMFRILGGTVVGMTGLPEAVLARELEMCYASISLVGNFAASISPSKVTIDEVFQIMEEKKKELINLIYNSIRSVSSARNCPCQCALDGAELG